MNISGFVGDPDFTFAFFVIHANHLLRDGSFKLVCVDVDLDFSFFIAPTELGHGYYCLIWHEVYLVGPLACINLHRVTTIDLAVS